MNQTIDLNALYQYLFGRPVEPAGQEYWSGIAPGIVQQYGMDGLKQRMIDSAHPSDKARNAMLGLEWDNYMANAAAADAGINAMPYVFSDYGSLNPATPDANWAKLYKQPGSLGGLGGMPQEQKPSGSR